MRRALLLCLVGLSVLADTQLQSNGTPLGPVTTINAAGGATRSGNVGTLTAGSANPADGWFDDGGSTAADVRLVQMGPRGFVTDGGGIIKGPMGLLVEGDRGVIITGLHSYTGDAVTIDDGQRFGWQGGAYLSATNLLASWTVQGNAWLNYSASTGYANFSGTLGLTVAGTMAATGAVTGSNLSGTNTGDQTKTCGAGTAVTTLAAGTGSTCATPWADSHLDGYFPSGILGAGTVFQSTRMTSSASWTRLAGTIVVAGTTGSAQTFTIDVYDLTTATVKCVSAATLCNVAAGIFSGACAASSVVNDDIELRINDVNCTTAPQLNVAAEYR